MPPTNRLTRCLSGPSPLTLGESTGACLALGSIIIINVAVLLFYASSESAIRLALCMTMPIAVVGVSAMTIAPWLRIRRTRNAYPTWLRRVDND